MASDELLERIDTHLARSNDLMKEVREEIELMRISYEHQLHVTRHAVVRNTEAMDALREEVREGFRGLRTDINEMRDAIRGLTDAVLRVLDRLDDGAQPAGA